jgi:hypothetical protein
LFHGQTNNAGTQAGNRHNDVVRIDRPDVPESGGLPVLQKGHQVKTMTHDVVALFVARMTANAPVKFVAAMEVK